MKRREAENEAVENDKHGAWKKADDEPFWDRLGRGEDGLPAHLPIGLDRLGRGPTEPNPAHHYGCWCGDIECPLAIALHYGWLSGRRSIVGAHEAIQTVMQQTAKDAVREFVAWLASNRAYNGSLDPGQSLYNEGINAVLPTWAEEWIAAQGPREVI